MIRKFFFDSCGKTKEHVRDLDSQIPVRRDNAPYHIFASGFFWGFLVGIATAAGWVWFMAGK